MWVFYVWNCFPSEKKKIWMDRQTPTSNKVFTLLQQSQYLMEMRIFENDVMEDKDYLTYCLSASDKLINRGGMSYLS